jgi:hypothetical protein
MARTVEEIKAAIAAMTDGEVADALDALPPHVRRHFMEECNAKLTDVEVDHTLAHLYERRQEHEAVPDYLRDAIGTLEEERSRRRGLH